MVNISFGLEISCSSTIGKNFHALLALVSEGERFIAAGLIVVKHDDLTKSFLKLVALLVSLISPFLEFREGNVFHL